MAYEDLKFYCGEKDKPRDVKCEVVPGRVFTNVDGNRRLAGDTVSVSRMEVELNKGILLEVGSDAWKEMKGGNDSDREAKGTQTREVGGKKATK